MRIHGTIIINLAETAHVQRLSRSFVKLFTARFDSKLKFRFVGGKEG